MDRMKTFLLYALGIIGFIFLSTILEDGLIDAMYVKMTGSINPSDYGIVIDEVSAKATNVNGNMKIRITNNSETYDKLYLKIDLFSKQDLLATTKYIEIGDLKVGDSKEYQIKLKGSELKKYDISIVNEDVVPDKTNIISILGWEIDLTDVFGMDLSNATIFGVKLTDLFSIDSVKTAGSNAWNWSVQILHSVPWWGYVIAGGIVLWYLPSGYLFGII